MPRWYDYYYTTPSRRFIEALSEGGFLYGILWPIIIDQAEKYDLDSLRLVNRFFAKHAGLAMNKFVWAFYCEHCTRNRPVQLDFNVLRNVECACWGADKFDFQSDENFRAFCALGDVDPDKGATSFEWILPGHRETNWIFASRTRDIVFDTYTNNPACSHDPYAHFFGITGRADKLWLMFQFARDNCEGLMEWGQRGFI